MPKENGKIVREIFFSSPAEVTAHDVPWPLLRMLSIGPDPMILVSK
jgi:hypothetical protein